MSYIFHPVGRPTETPRPEDAALPSYYFRSRVSSKNCTNFRENYNIVFYFHSCTIYSNNIYARTPNIKEKRPSIFFFSRKSAAVLLFDPALLLSLQYTPPPEVKPTLDETWCSGTLRIGCSSRGCPLGVSVVLMVRSIATLFVKEQRRKISRAKPAKFFAPLTTTKTAH